MSEDDNFLSRWSRRKALARQGQPLVEPVAVPPAVTRPSGRPSADHAQVVQIPPASPDEASPESLGPKPDGLAPDAHSAPVPTLEDVAKLPANASDYSRFVARNVQPEVKNAALKKLFSDPHFNVMDGLDIYIDDYSRPDPLPAGMLRQLAQSQFLGLFAESPTALSNMSADQPAGMPTDASPHPLPTATSPPSEACAEPDPGPAPTPSELAPSPLEPSPHEDADLRLQPDPCTGPSGLATGPAPSAGG